jgi:RsiW-degrading membrane proteinase PrsW (M82 family)
MTETQLRCCIDDEPVSPPYNILGGRVYCARHFALVNKPHPGFWRSAVIMILGIGILSGILSFLLREVEGLDRMTLIIVGILLAVIPTAAWLVYFYRQDRLEPEPKERIGSVLVTAAVLTDFVGLRVINDWFQVARWASYNNWTSLGASILINGFIFAAIMYLAVRVWVYKTSEYDERMDGIVYGTVAGLGVATMLNLHYIIDNQGVALAPGIISVVTTALAQASFGGVLGYFMAQAKFEHKPVWWVPAGVVISAVINGLFSWLINEVSATGLTVEPWRSLVLGLFVALFTFGALVMLMQRAHAYTMRHV